MDFLSVHNLRVSSAMCVCVGVGGWVFYFYFCVFLFVGDDSANASVVKVQVIDPNVLRINERWLFTSPSSFYYLAVIIHASFTFGTLNLFCYSFLFDVTTRCRFRIGLLSHHSFYKKLTSWTVISNGKSNTLCKRIRLSRIQERHLDWVFFLEESFLRRPISPEHKQWSCNPSSDTTHHFQTSKSQGNSWRDPWS